MKTYLKTLTRVFKKHITRFISVVFMVLISVGFISGIGSATDKINYSLTDYYKAKSVSDFIIKSTGSAGFSAEDIAAVKDCFKGAKVNLGTSLDVTLTVNGEERLTRLYFLDFDDWTVNMCDLIDGNEMKQGDNNGVYSERADNKIKGISTDTEVEIDFKKILAEYGVTLPFELKRTITVKGVVQSPLTFAQDGEPSYKNEDLDKPPTTIGEVNSLITLDDILYIPKSVIPTYPMGNTPILPINDIYIAVENRGIFQAFSKEYKTFVNAKTAQIDALLSDVKTVTLYDNYSFVSLNAYGQKVTGIAIVLMVAFMFVTALVVLSTMTRLLEEERSQIACLKTLGYSPSKIIFKYVLFAAIATGIGGTGAYFVGIGIARLLYIVFHYSFAMPPISSHVALVFYLITFILIVLVTLLSTLIAGIKMSNEKPAELLRPKAPKAGRKVILEKIPFLWNRLSFKYKSTMRNVLRYQSRFFMTVIAVAVSTALILAGLGLLDLCLFGGIDSTSVMLIAVVVVFFAALLTMVVIYTLTNINISERNRELATLMVLGYHRGEVAGYIYREIYVDTAAGIIVGYPLSLLLMYLVFSIMEMGTIGGVTWFWWLVAPVLVLLSTFIVTMILRRKIVNIDMNESLKAIE